MRTSDEARAAMVAYLKTKVTRCQSEEIREAEYQSQDWVYPGIRVSVDFIPSVNGCGPDVADFVIESFSEQKSSLEAEQMSAEMVKFLHKHPFSRTITLPGSAPVTVQFPVVVVTSVERADRSIFAWLSRVRVHTQVN